MKGSDYEQSLVANAAGAPASLSKGKRKHATAPNPLAVKKSSKFKKDEIASGSSQKRIRRKRQTGGEDTG